MACCFSSSEGWAELTTLSEWLIDLYDRIRSEELPEYTVFVLKERKHLLPLRERMDVFQAVVQAHQEALGRVRQFLEFDDARRFEGRRLGELPLTEQRGLFGDWQQGLEKIPEIIALNYTLAELTAAELAPFVDLGLSWSEASTKLVATFKMPGSSCSLKLLSRCGPTCPSLAVKS